MSLDSWIGMFLIVVAIVLFTVLIAAPMLRGGTNTDIEAESAPAGAVTMIIVLMALLAILCCGMYLFLYGG